MVMMTSTITCAKKTKKKVKKLKELSLLGGRSNMVTGRLPKKTLLLFSCQDGSTHLKALYIGRYQQMKEQGVKSRAQRMARPRPTPPEASTQNMAREEIRLNSSVHVQTRH